MLIATIFTAKQDIYGNRYSYITLENTKNNKSISFQCGWGGGDNEYSSIRTFFNYQDNDNKIIKCENIPIREFNSDVKKMPFIKNMKKELNKLGFRKRN